MSRRHLGWLGKMELPQPKRETGFFQEVWKAHNKMRACVRSLIIQQSGRGVTASRTSNGTILKVEEQARGGLGELKQFRLKLIYDDYYECREFDGETETGALTPIAKQYELRKTGWHG